MLFGIDIKYRKKFFYISGFNFHILKRHAAVFFDSRKVSNFIEPISDNWFNRSFKIHEFFLPELIYFLNSINNSATRHLLKTLSEKTWYRNVIKYQNTSIPMITDLSLIDKEMNVSLKSYQLDFIKEYNRKIIYNLNGYLLAFEQGLGKTLTSLALMTSLNKKSVVIICPKKTMLNVWKYHIDTFYKSKKKIWIANIDERHKTNADYYITNYESMSKLPLSSINPNNGIIVDESHNFLHINSLRTINLIKMSNLLGCKDILLMSGTPIKAIGYEMIPILSILDPKFDEDALEIFKKSFGLSTENANKLFHNRLGLLMYRKLKEEVLQLPEKHEITLKVKTPHANKYTLDNVKLEVISFIQQRKEYHSKHKKEYETMFQEVLNYLGSLSKIKNSKDWLKYNIAISKLKLNKYSKEEWFEVIKWCNNYEKTVLIPLLPIDLKKKFVYCKSAVKYLMLKIMGEVIGGLLNHLRDEMCQELIKYSNLDKIIKQSEKKTILFTSYTNCVELAEDYLKSKGYNPTDVYGKTKDPERSIKNFRENPDVNPLVASIQTLATGVTLTEANTIIFLNKPWRYIEYQQASDRIHRIGQDTEVYIYTLILDTGSKLNLSTRMEEIETWSKQMFDQIVDMN